MYLDEGELTELKTIIDIIPIVGERHGGRQEALLNS